ncbi:hypothetical protein C0992_001061, partial [Termitomyces sp. T32_za158]
MLKIGGYAMSYADAKAWALHRYPDINIYNENTLPFIIEQHNKALGGENLECIAVAREGQVWCIFVTHEEDDPTATRMRFDLFPMDDYAKLYGQMVFPRREDREK